MTVLGRANNGPASVSLGFQAVTVPVWTPGAASAALAYVTGISVSRAPAGTSVGAPTQGTLDRSRNCAARSPATCRTRNSCSVSPGPASPSRRNAPDAPPSVRTTYSDP